MRQKEILVGSHISSAGGVHLAVERGESIGCTSMQIFTKSSRMWFSTQLKIDEIERFKQEAKKSPIKIIVSHAGYLINIASPNPNFVKKSLKSLIDEITRCEQLNIPYLVLHPGSHLGAGEEKGIENISKNLEFVLDAVPGKTMILLETMAGQGTNLGYKFEQLKNMIKLCKSPYRKRIGICFDTCHAFAAGYDISTEETYKQTMKELDKVIGFKYLKTIHLNDSYGELGSRVDRHAPLKKGKIPIKTFELIMNDGRLKKIPKIIETPSDPDMKLWKKEIKLLKSLVK